MLGETIERREALGHDGRAQARNARGRTHRERVVHRSELLQVGGLGVAHHMGRRAEHPVLQDGARSSTEGASRAAFPASRSERTPATHSRHVRRQAAIASRMKRPR